MPRTDWNPLETRFPEPEDGPFTDIVTCAECGSEIFVEASLGPDDDQEDDGTTDRGEIRVLIAHGSEFPKYCPVCAERTDYQELGRWL